MELIRKFEYLGKEDAQVAGGKGASLGEMTKAGIPVPPGFVVLSEAFEYFLAEGDLNQEIEAILGKVDRDNIATVEQAAESIQALILAASMPENIAKEVESNFSELDSKYVAVRSSATAEDGAEHAWAGQLDSYLNTDKENLHRNIQRCWASLFTPRAIFYRFEKDLDDTKISVAVVVQKMVASEVSGIAFSVHPITEDRNQLIIEAGYGLGEAIVSGQITPDSYVVEKEPRKIIDRNIAEQVRGIFRKAEGGNEWREIEMSKRSLQKLSDEQISGLSEIILRIENHYGFPCDIEWAFEDGKFYVVQSRPITTLSVHEEKGSQLNNAVDEMKKYSFEKHISYQFIPVICFESSCKCYVDNPYLEKFGARDYPNFISILDGSYEAWGDWSKRFMFKDVAMANEIIDECRIVIDRHEGYVDEINASDFSGLSKPEINEVLKKLDSIATEIYHLYIFFIDECFEVDDDALNARLPEVRMELSSFVSKIYAGCDKIIEALAGMFQDVPWEVFTRATFEEIDKILNESEEDHDGLLSYEKRPIAFAAINNKLHVFTGSEALDMKKYLENADISSADIGRNKESFPGAVAYKGKASGQVIRIMESDYKDAGKIIGEMKGYVLVTPMTRPEIVPFLGNAAAIVTDEGGITCHAAIVSRELKIPCIVGTKFATKVLKNGDLVEVDADNGVVRILERIEKDSDIDNGLSYNFLDKTVSDYQQLFQLRGKVRFLMSSIFMEAYRENSPIVVFNDSIWRSFMPYIVRNERLNEGLDLYGSIEKYESFRKDISDRFSDSEKLFNDILKKDVLNKEDVKKYFSTAVAYHRLYSKTEFFYTDSAFSEQENNPIVKENFQSFEQLKLDGRSNLNKILFGEDCYYNLIIRKISSQLNLSTSDITGYGIDELEDIFDGINIQPELMKDRKDAYVMKFEGGNLAVACGSDAVWVIGLFLAPLSKKSDMIRGQVANKGKVTAKAKIFNYTTDNFDGVYKLVDEMEKGQIIVADTTSPEIILACKKASAIVTNQGGMMSHAAIVAREMNIPCIVGTNTATEVIHDGDLVEIDADNGVVRILKRVQK